MAKAGIIPGLVVWCAVASAAQASPAAGPAGADAAQQASAPAPVSGSQRFRDEIKMVEETLPRLVDRGRRFFC